MTTLTYWTYKTTLKKNGKGIMEKGRYCGTPYQEEQRFDAEDGGDCWIVGRLTLSKESNTRESAVREAIKHFKATHDVFDNEADATTACAQKLETRYLRLDKVEDHFSEDIMSCARAQFGDLIAACGLSQAEAASYLGKKDRQGITDMTRGKTQVYPDQIANLRLLWRIINAGRTDLIDPSLFGPRLRAETIKALAS